MWRAWRQRYADEVRALVVHLHDHEDTAARARENVVSALERHLGWHERKADAVLARGLAQGLVLKEGSVLHLTPKGRDVARELLEPWRRHGG
jgi:manganese/zinc/iron transport system permease protein